MRVLAPRRTRPRKSQRRRSVVKNTTARSPMREPTSTQTVE
jgi:hypothetical protein